MCLLGYDDDDGGAVEEFRFNDVSIHEGHSHQNGLFTLFGIEKMSYHLIRNSKIHVVV